MAAARTPSRSGSVHSSRSGGCVAAFLRVFDWNSSKGFSSSRRLLPGSRGQGQGVRRSIFEDDHHSVGAAKGSLIPNIGFANTPTPGVRVRLDSLPDGPFYRHYNRSESCNSGSDSLSCSGMEVEDHSETPVILQDLLHQDYFECSSQKSVKKRLLRFVKTSQESDEAPSSHRHHHRYHHDALLVTRRIERKDERLSFLSRLDPALRQSSSRSHTHHMTSAPFLNSQVKKTRASRLLKAAVKILEPRSQASMWGRTPKAKSHQSHVRSHQSHASQFRSRSQDSTTTHDEPQHKKVLERSGFETSLPNFSVCTVKHSDGGDNGVGADGEDANPKLIPKTLVEHDLTKAFLSNESKYNEQAEYLNGFPIVKVLRNLKGQQEKVNTLSGSRVYPLENAPEGNSIPEGGEILPKSILSNGKFFGGRKNEDEEKVLVKRRKQGGQKGRVMQVSCQFPSPRCTVMSLGFALKQISKHSVQGDHQNVAMNRALVCNNSHNNHNAEAEPQVDTKVPSPCRSDIARRPTVTKPEMKCRSRNKRTRTVDEVFPELSVDVNSKNLRRLHKGGHAVAETDFDSYGGGASGTLNCWSIKGMLGKCTYSIVSRFDTRNRRISYPSDNLQSAVAERLAASKRKGPSQPQVDCTSQQRRSSVGSVDLHWEETISNVHAVHSSRNSEELVNSGEPVQEPCNLLDEPECRGSNNGYGFYNIADEGSTSKPHQLAQAHLEGNGDEESLHPVGVKGFRGQDDFDVEETGQPSPVSILEAPFHDEPCETLQSNLEESFKDVLLINSPHTDLLELEPSYTTVETNNSNNSSSSSSNSEKLQQALLDISMFVRHETYNFECTKGQISQEDENHHHHRHHHSFVHKILSAGQVLCSRPGNAFDWFDENLAIDPSLFDRLENDDDYEQETITGFWRCDRRLLFDCTNEAVSLTLGKPQLCLLQSPRVTDEKLVEEVYAKILEWQELPSYSISGLIEKDMGSRVGKWSNLSEEIAEVGLEVECMVWKAILEDVVLDLIITTSEKETC